MKKITTTLALLCVIFSFYQSAAQSDSCLGLEPPKGFAITDNTAEYYRIDAIDSTTPEVTSCPIVVNGTPIVMNGEGSAYDPFANRYYVFNNSDLYYIDLGAPCDGSTNTYLVQANTSIVGTSQGAELIYDSATMTPTLWVLDDNLPAGVLRKLDPLTGNELYNVTISGASKLDGIAIDPATGIFYGQDDDVVEVYRIDTATGVATSCFNLPPMDGEALSFGSDGRIYTEMDRGDTSRIIWAADVPANCTNTTLPVTAVATFLTTNGDVENFGMNGPACFLEAPLYVYLNDFTGKVYPDYNELIWETAIEKNHSYFILERNTGAKYEQIAIIPSQANGGNSNEPLDYSFTDMNPSSVNYYRLTSVDLDGKEKRHPVVLLNRTVMSSINIYPNPTDNILNVQVAQEDLEDIKIKIVDLQGRELYNSGWITNDGLIKKEIELSNFSAGFYLLNMTNEQGFNLVKEIIKK
jgi:hypothetical protein